MLVSQLLDNVSAATDFVLINEKRDLVFGFNAKEDKANGFDKYEIHFCYPEVEYYEVNYWWVSDDGRIWCDVKNTNPISNMRECIEEFFDYAESLGVGGLT